MSKDEIAEIFEPWWDERIETLPEMADMSLEDVIDLVLGYMQRFRSAEDFDVEAQRIANKLLTDVRKKAIKADPLQQTQCAALVLNMLLTFMRLVGDKKLTEASRSLHAIMESKSVSTFASSKSIYSCLTEHALDLQKALKVIWEGDAKDSACFPLGFLSLEKTKGLYIVLRCQNIIEEAVMEEDFLQLFGCRNSSQKPEQIKWLANKDDLLFLLRHIYDKWTREDKPSWESIKKIAHAYFVKKDGTQYNEQMSEKDSYKGKNAHIVKFVATL